VVFADYWLAHTYATVLKDLVVYSVNKVKLIIVLNKNDLSSVCLQMSRLDLRKLNTLLLKIVAPWNYASYKVDIAS